MPQAGRITFPGKRFGQDGSLFVSVGVSAAGSTAVAASKGFSAAFQHTGPQGG